MADQTFQNPNTSKSTTSGPGSQGFQQPGSPGFQQAASSARGVADQAASDARDLKNKAMGLAGSSTEAIKDQASGLVDTAKSFASQAADKLTETVDDQKNAGAEYVGNLAETLRRAAREFDKDLPVAGAWIRKAASQVETVSDTIKTGNVSDLVREAQDFARKQPTAFLGLTVLAGFGAVRFLKSSAAASNDEAGMISNNGGNRRSHSGSGSFDAGRRTGNEGYRDDFTK